MEWGYQGDGYQGDGYWDDGYQGDGYQGDGYQAHYRVKPLLVNGSEANWPRPSSNS